MINNRQAGRRRGRGNNNNGGGGGGGQRQGGGGGGQGGRDTGNRIDSRARGNASQLYEKYKNLARDAQMQGDRVNIEYYLQFADHYFRVLSETRARFEESQPQAQQQPRRQQPFDLDGDDDYGDEGEPIRSGEQQGSQQGSSDVQQGGGQNGQYQNAPRQPRESQNRESQNRESGYRDGQNRDGQNRDVQNRDERPRYDANRNDGQRGENQRDGQREDRVRGDSARTSSRPVQQREDRPVQQRDERTAQPEFVEAGNAQASDDTGAREYRDAPRREPVRRPRAARATADQDVSGQDLGGQDRAESTGTPTETLGTMTAPDTSGEQPATAFDTAAAAPTGEDQPRRRGRPRRDRSLDAPATVDAAPAAFDADRLPPSLGIVAAPADATEEKPRRRRVRAATDEVEAG